MAIFNLNVIISKWVPISGVALWIALNEAISFWVNHHLPMLRRYPIFRVSWIQLGRAHNYGLLGDYFSALPKGEIEHFTFQAPAALLAIAALLLFFLLKGASRMEKWGASLMLLSGALNLWASWSMGYVTDTFQLFLGDDTFLPFNLADVGILLGTSVLMGRALFELGTLAFWHFRVSKAPVSR